MKRRISTEFWGVESDILYSVRKKEFYFYEIEFEKIHRKYGGRKYYSSQTGLSGAGYIEPEEKDNDIIFFGSYRIDIKGVEQRIKKVYLVREDGQVRQEGKEIFGYVPIKGHKGFDFDFPVVLSDGRKVCFVTEEEVQETLLCWNEQEGQTKEFVYFKSSGEKELLKWELFNPHKFTKLDALRFVDLKKIKENQEIIENHKEEDESLFSRKLRIVREKGEKKWFHLNKNNIFDYFWAKDPREIKGGIVNGWNGNGKGFFWKRVHDRVLSFMEIKRKSLSKGKYELEKISPDWVSRDSLIWVEFEEDLEILEFYSKDVSHFQEYFERKCLEKARKDFIYAIRQHKTKKQEAREILKMMEKSKDIPIRIQDSLEVGNCLRGTEIFIKENNISLDEDGYVYIRDLLENPNIKNMLNEFSFRKTISYKLLSEED